MIYSKLSSQGPEILDPSSATRIEASPTDAQQIYLSFENLEDYYTTETNFDEIFNKLYEGTKAKHEWKVHFDILENLRILNKFKNQEFVKKIPFFTPFLYQGVDSLRSNVSKNALLLIREIIQLTNDFTVLQELLLKILPLTLEKAVSEKTFIKTEAKNALKELEKNGCCDVSIYVLGEKSFDKNSQLCELAMQTLCEIVKNVKENLGAKLTKQGLKILFKTLAKNLEGKRASLKRMSEDAIRNISGFISKNGALEDYLKLEMELNENEVTLIQAALQEKKNNKTRNELQKFLQEKKMKADNEPSPSTPSEKVIEFKVELKKSGTL
jgi:hypothetical protein